MRVVLRAGKQWVEMAKKVCMFHKKDNKVPALRAVFRLRFGRPNGVVVLRRLCGRGGMK
jgi:hypothetical protein